MLNGKSGVKQALKKGATQGINEKNGKISDEWPQ
jgi:hypothetical protein